MKKIFTAIVFLVSVSSLACQDHRSEHLSFEKNSEDKKDVLAQVRDIASAMRTCSDEDPSKHSPFCTFEDSRWTPETFSWFENGPRVLIIDQPMPVDTLVLGRYKNRTLELLHLEDSGEYVPLLEHSASEIRKGFNELSKITGSHQNYVSAKTLHDMGEGLDKLFVQDLGRLSKNNNILHSMGITGIIGEYTPTASFVFAPFPLIPASMLCSKDFPAIEGFARKAGQSLAERVKAQGITIINMSGGEDRRNATKYFEGICSFTPRKSEIDLYLNSMKSFFRELDKSDALIIQAAPETDSHNIEEDYSIDCDASLMKNRLRVGFLYEHPKVFISEHGTDGSSIPFGIEINKYYNASKCIDVYVSLGMDFNGNSQNPLYLSNGIQFKKSSTSCTSFIAPVLSAFVAEKQSSGEWKGLSSAEQKNRLMGEFQSVAIHPLKYRQFEAYRMKIWE